MAATDELLDLSQPASFLPDYREMILEAIEALNETNSSSMTDIASFIVSRYGDLPNSHTAILTHHLNTMKDAGELVIVGNNFSKVENNPLPKRGRGRPPKAKTSAPVAVHVGPPRGRGRPPKNQAAQSSTVNLNSVVLGSGKPRGRGRPSKKAKVDESTTTGPDPLSETDGIEQVTMGPLPETDGIEQVTTGPVAAVGEVRRGRGRPPKV